MATRGVGRPALPLTSPTITPRQGLEGLTGEERMAAAFQRMRDLNNLASRRCRRRRREEVSQRETQLETLINKNTELKIKVAEMEERVKNVKESLAKLESGEDSEEVQVRVKLVVEDEVEVEDKESRHHEKDHTITKGKVKCDTNIVHISDVGTLESVSLSIQTQEKHHFQ